MVCRRGQVSFEYLILIGFVVFAILVPSFMVLFSSVNANVRDTLSNQKMVDLGHGLTNDAKQMYYLGLYSRKISTYDVPENIRHMFILKITYDNKEYTYFGIAILDGDAIKTQTFLSDVPLTSELSENVVIDNSLKNLVKECSLSGYSCEFYSFNGPIITPGLKKFKIETVWNDGIIQSSIIPILT